MLVNSKWGDNSGARAISKPLIDVGFHAGLSRFSHREVSRLGVWFSDQVVANGFGPTLETVGALFSRLGG